MFKKTLFCLLCVVTVAAYAEVNAVIEAPKSANIGDLVVIDSTKAVGDNKLWVVDPRLTGKYLQFGDQIVFASGTPGNYKFQLIVADKEAAIDQTTHEVQVGSGNPPTQPDPPTDPKPEDPKPDPPTTGKVRGLSRASAELLNDKDTAKLLVAELENAVSKISSLPVADQRELVQMAVAKALLERKGASQKVDWHNGWRVKVNEALASEPDSQYPSLIREAIEGLKDSLNSTLRVQQAPKTQADTKPQAVGVKDPITGYIASKDTVVMLSTDNCVYCDAWWTPSEPVLKGLGFDVLDTKTFQTRVASPTGRYPYFSVYTNGKWTGTQKLDDAVLKALMSK